MFSAARNSDPQTQGSRKAPPAIPANTRRHIDRLSSDMALEIADGLASISKTLSLKRGIVTFGGSNRLLGRGKTRKDYLLLREVAYQLGRQGWDGLTGSADHGASQAAINGMIGGGGRVGALRYNYGAGKASKQLDVLCQMGHPQTGQVVQDKLTSGFVIAPGGFGTMDLLYEAAPCSRPAFHPSGPFA